VTYQVFLSEKAQRDLDTIPSKQAEQILADCRRLADDPVPDGKRIKKLQGLKKASTGSGPVITAWCSAAPAHALTLCV
jgi:mRNA-degrading endonuclease RelE of RelBE toxin-antitoxin system